jgi:RHS repeat-associated protein
VGDKDFYVKAQSGGALLAGSGSWTIDVQADTTPNLTSFTPSTAIVDQAKTFTVNGTNIPSTVIASIEGMTGLCSRNSYSSTQAKFTCTPNVVGDKDFYVKAQSGGARLAGSGSWTIDVQEVREDNSILTVSYTGQGKVFSSPVNEIDCGSNCSYQYKNDSKVTLVASAATGWEFSAWNYDRALQSNDCTTASCELLIKEDFTLTAVFIEQETPSTDTRLIDFTPKRAPQDSATTFTLVGENLTNSTIGNIESTNEHCQLLTFSETVVTMSCTPDVQGQQRFYIKDTQNENKHEVIAGSEHWYVEVTPPVNSNAPSVWSDNVPDYAILDQQFFITVKSEDIDNDLYSIQADWEGDNNLDRIVLVNNTSGQDIQFSYTRSNNDLSNLTIRFIATDSEGNQSTFERVIPVIAITVVSDPTSGYEGKENVISTDGGECIANPIMPSNGAKVEQKQLLKVNGVVPVTFDISYNSLIRGQSGVGVGWDFANAHAAQVSEKPNGGVTILWSDNQQHKFTPNGDGTYATQSFGCRLDRLTKLDNGGFKVERRNRLTYVFNEFHFLTRIENIKGQGVNFEFDSQSRLIKAYEPVSNASINYLYNNDGFLSQATTSAGRSVSLEYQNKQLTKIVHADGIVEEFTYNALDQIVDHYLDFNIVSTTTYDDKGRATEQDDSRDDNLKLKLNYEETDDFITTTITDRTGEVTVKKFDKNYQLITETDSLNEQQHIVYNADGKPTKVTNARGYISEMEYNEYGDITELLTANGATDKKQYDANRNIIKHTNALRKVTEFDYIENTNNVETVTNPLGFETYYTYNADNQQASVTTPEGRTTYFNFTSGLLTSITNPEGNTRQIYYDSDGYITSETDFKGNTTTYERDGFGRVTRKEDPLGLAETWVYDARGNVLEYGDTRFNSEANNYAGKIKYTYNGQGDLTEKRWVSKYFNTPDVVNSYKYDGESRLIESSDPNGNTVKFTRDALGRLVETTDAEGNVTKSKFDENGNLIEATDALNNISKASFDEMDQVESTTDALNNQQSFTYNLLGQIEETTNALAQLWKNTYDDLSRLVSITHPSDADTPLIAKQTFDKDNNTVNVITPSDDTRTLVLNDNAQVSTETTADNVQQQYSYNENGLITSSINGRGQETTLEYDDGSRLISVMDEISTISYQYDENHNIASTTENDITISRLFDKFNRVGQYKQNSENLQGLNYLIDDVGNVEQLQYTNNNANTNLPIKYTYDKLNRVKTVSALNQEDILAEYEYDNNHNVTKIIRGNGTVLVNTYDELNRLKSSTDITADGSVILQQSYTYNAISQLTEETVTPDSVPPIGLLAEQVMTYTADNRIATKGSETFDFDDDGNTLNIGELALSFNVRNQLESAGEHQYAYNAEGMRVSQIVIKDNTEQVIKYALLPDYLGLPQIAWQSINDEEYQFFVYSPHGLIAQRNSNGNEEYYFHYDYRGSVVAITDNDGEVIARYGYTPFGQKYAAEGFEETNKAVSTPFGYNGRDGVITDANGLLYMRARYYSPELRRFVSKDPLRGELSDLGSLNRYAYVGGDPVNFIDPSGLTHQNSYAKSKWQSMYELLQLQVSIMSLGSYSPAAKLTTSSKILSTSKVAPKFTFADELLEVANKSTTTPLASTKLHKSNANYIGDQKLYKIQSSIDDEVNKFGITGNGYNSQGQLIRSQQQINKLNSTNNSNYSYTEQSRFYGSTGTNRVMENIKIRVGKDVFGECKLNVGYH